ncbi:MAG TPA: polysaccharide lyase beta-sandwich domain-containing protein, partial [Thermoanaerobaculia bacterium]|nr:polysaccharide lyase beta-sandwich domain-containing protein [Thermoanaerobaculia bacterium]
NDLVSAARDNRNGNLGITFWRAASIDGIQSSAPAVVYITSDRNTMHIWAADPNATATGAFTLTVPGVWTATGATSSRSTRSTTLTIPRNGGQTTHVTLQRNVKRRAVG